MTKIAIDKTQQDFIYEASQSKTSYTIWLICAFFVILQFFIQLSSGIIIVGSIMQEMQLSALTASILSSSFYVIYTILQIPVGILGDKYNSRLLLTLSAITFGIGCMFFASSHTLVYLFIARVLIGIGSSFAFVIMVHIVRNNYSIKYFSTLIGACETLGFFATVIGIICMGQFIDYLGWRGLMKIASMLGILLSVLFWFKIPNTHKKPTIQVNYAHSLKQIVTNPLLWMNGFFIGLCFATITVFGALWAAPFLQLKLKCDIQYLTFINSLLLLGASIGCPFFGYLSTIIKKRRPLTVISCTISAVLFAILIFIPSKNLITHGVIIFLLGFCCCSYILAYAISNELSPKNALSTCTGFTNSLALITAPMLQPLIGYILDTLSVSNIYTLSEYQKALTILPIGLLIAGLLVSFLPEKTES